MNPDPAGPDYGITPLQARMLTRYLPATERDGMPWPTAANECTSVRALVRRRLMSRNGKGLLHPSDKGRRALELNATRR